MQQHIRWTILATNNYQQSKAFYVEKLGFKIEREVEADEFCQFALDNGYFALFNRKNLQQVVGADFIHEQVGGGAVYSFPDSTDIDLDYKQLKEKGVTFIKEPATQPWGQRTAYFTDPDGHIWELQQWLK